jgi:hypothetical protein
MAKKKEVVKATKAEPKEIVVVDSLGNIKRIFTDKALAESFAKKFGLKVK